MSPATDGSYLFCGAIDCTEPADVVIRHPEHGSLIVCDECSGGYEVVQRV